ncbi:AcrR family transcriptional regulator [Prauserella isguenensis]|uniref:AcrR family transcriptional regulator n=1 Tax=Prauserella isguenensis TaxID=1470180 RepID=A0A839S010_9PSEU|nr:TetR/AcrR family transcriptional regulator [Prauserella isguenensis]MBB3050865.1 AcrR family transcriptional regulator [Prauserella isguenensis]
MSEHNDPARATRRSGEELREAILDAVLCELFDRGYAGLTFDGVAHRAHTSKPVIYRRYATRAQMVLDALIRHAPADLPSDSAGDLRSDLMALGLALGRRFEQIGITTVRRLIADVDDDLLPQLAELAAAPAEQALQRVLDAARARGELGPEPLPERIAMLPLALWHHEMLFIGHVDEAAVADIVDRICLPLLTRRV